MFGFLTSGKDIADPLVSAKAVSVWLRQLPALDVIGRQQHVMRAFDAMRLARQGVDPARVAAIQFLDAALGADRRQLLKQYVENAEGAARLSERIWQATHELAQGFVFAYQWLLDAALAQPAYPLMNKVFALHPLDPAEAFALRAFLYQANLGGEPARDATLSVTLFGGLGAAVSVVALNAAWRRRLRGVRKPLTQRRATAS